MVRVEASLGKTIVGKRSVRLFRLPVFFLNRQASNYEILGIPNQAPIINFHLIIDVDTRIVSKA